MTMKRDFLVVGVGGQGAVLASDILAEVGLVAGYDVKKSDVLGLAVRGGSVVSHVRWGGRVASPVALPGKVNYLLGFEPLEALRAVGYLAPNGTALVNTHPVPPVSVSSGDAIYPDLEQLRLFLGGTVARLRMIPATEMATRVGNAKAANAVMLGACGVLLDVPFEQWQQVIRLRVPQKSVELNVQAFRAGWAWMEKEQS